MYISIFYYQDESIYNYIQWYIKREPDCTIQKPSSTSTAGGTYEQHGMEDM